jgi:hypothetical protein
LVLKQTDVMTSWVAFDKDLFQKHFVRLWFTQRVIVPNNCIAGY